MFLVFFGTYALNYNMDVSGLVKPPLENPLFDVYETALNNLSTSKDQKEIHTARLKISSYKDILVRRPRNDLPNSKDIIETSNRNKGKKRKNIKKSFSGVDNSKFRIEFNIYDVEKVNEQINNIIKYLDNCNKIYVPFKCNEQQNKVYNINDSEENMYLVRGEIIAALINTVEELNTLSCSYTTRNSVINYSKKYTLEYLERLSKVQSEHQKISRDCIIFNETNSKDRLSVSHHLYELKKNLECLECDEFVDTSMKSTEINKN